MVTRNPFAVNRPPDEGIKPATSKSHKRSKVQEREIANRYGAKLVARSGAGDEKGDVRLRRVARIEAKTTKNKTFPVSLELMRKLEENVTTDEACVLLIEFNQNGKKLGELAVIPSYLLDEFIARAKP